MRHIESKNNHSAPDIHFMTFDNKDYVALPVDEIENLTHIEWKDAIEDALTARIVRDHRNNPQESFPAALVEKLLAGENPVKCFREYRILNQDELAEQAGLDRSYLSGIENGKRKASKKKLQAIAKVLGVDVEDLV